ncbi:MAG: 50S ribosomal protein L21 [candidate division WS2 bacterium]|uniref:Large ribosomal subunit protein bL21 n=1 Tax=Psychracetigena formicireducens TaxID=2986056 RepID=A0A9E2BHM7_PSYF1|nr:50S ribosomal protein L21 [Candidatus Psychracetigena formicireducens]MBT9144310.1 50S ribosomal protein L21 [Candidatus Psychracetigena formicireducens]
MYAIIDIRGRQIKLEPNKVYKLPFSTVFSEQDVYQWNKVILVNRDGELLIGKPYLEGASVSLKLLKQGRDRKIIVFKYKSKRDYHKKVGYRDPYILVKVESIQA